MSALAFLIPDAGAADTLARTPMERRALAAGARFEARDGWNVAVAYDGPQAEQARLTGSVAFADRSSLGKFEVQAGPATLARVLAAASPGLGLEPRGATRSGDGSWCCPVTPSRMLILGQPSASRELRLALAQAAADEPGPIALAEVTCALAALAVAGPGADELLARFCAIDVRPAVMPVGAFRPGSVARTPGYVLRESQDELLVMVGWALGDYLYRVVADAAAHLGGGPIGADALAAAREPQRA